MIYSSFLLLIILFVFNRFIFKTNLAPSVLFNLLWIVIVFICILFDQSLITRYKLADITLIIIVLGNVSFSFGAFLANHRPILVKPSAALANNGGSAVFINLLLVLAGCLLPVTVYKAYTFIAESPIQSIFIALRSELSNVEDKKDYGMAAYGITFSNLALWLSHENYLRTKTGKGQYVISLIFVILYCVLSTGRTFFFLAFIPFFVITFTMKGMKYSSLIRLLVILVFVFLCFGFLKTYGTVEETDITDFWEAGIVPYLLGGIYGLNSMADTFVLFRFGDGENVFRTFYAVLNATGADVKVSPLVQEFVYDPMFTNVYSIFYTYVSDFGIFGMLFFLTGIGYFHTFCYLNKQRTTILILYSVMMYPLIMSFFQDQYFSLLTTWAQYMLLLFCRWVFINLKFK